MDQRFLRNEMLWGRRGQERLAASHVILFGPGGIGSYAAECLARSAVVEPFKTGTVAARIRDITPSRHPAPDPRPL